MTGEGLPAETFRKLRRVAARHARVAHEADDLVQDVLLAAIEHGRDCTDARFLPWAIGAIRNHARFTARTAMRRRRREQMFSPTYADECRPRFPDAFIASLPPSRRIVALLVNLGMNRAEIGYLLGLSDFALRQRISGLRRIMASHPAYVELSSLPQPAIADGIARRALKAALPRGGTRLFGMRDPDGLPLFFSSRGHVLRPHGN